MYQQLKSHRISQKEKGANLHTKPQTQPQPPQPQPSSPRKQPHTRATNKTKRLSHKTKTQQLEPPQDANCSNSRNSTEINKGDYTTATTVDMDQSNNTTKPTGTENGNARGSATASTPTPTLTSLTSSFSLSLHPNTRSAYRTANSLTSLRARCGTHGTHGTWKLPCSPANGSRDPAGEIDSLLEILDAAISIVGEIEDDVNLFIENENEGNKQ